MTAERARLRVLLGALAWILVAIAPVVGWIMVGPQLDGTRYLYWRCLPGRDWLSSWRVGREGQAPRTIAAVALIAIIGLNAVATRRQINAWSLAAAERDGILAAVLSDARVRECHEMSIADLPDTVRGVYVFRNGVPEALAQLGMPPISATAPEQCQFRWDSTTGTLRVHELP